MDRKVWIGILGGLFCIGVIAVLVIAYYSGAQFSGGTRQPSNPQQELAFRFYKAYHLNQDAEAAWEMMHPLHQQGWTRKEIFLRAWRDVIRMETPQQIDVQEWRRPQQRHYVYLFRAEEIAPVVIEVAESEDGGLSVIASRIWEGESLP